jgi:hypothetical protein
LRGSGGTSRLRGTGQLDPDPVEHTVPFQFVVYSLVTAWCALHGHHREDLAQRRAAQPRYPHKGQPAFEDMLAGLRRTLVAARITGVAAARPMHANTATTNWPAPQPPHRRESQS